MENQPGKIYASLATFAKECKGIVKDSTNPHFKSNYASLSAIQEGIKNPLERSGLILVHAVQVDAVTSTVYAEDGTFVSSTFPFTIGKPQENGSAVTYAKRYNTAALLNLDTDADDDGNEAQNAVATVAKSAYKSDLAKAEYTGTHVCTKAGCGKEVVGPDIFDGKFGKCFKCPHCGGFSKPNPKKDLSNEAASIFKDQKGVPTKEDIEAVPFN